MKKILTPLLVAIPLLLSAQTPIKDGVTFRLENLSKPEKLLPTGSMESVFRSVVDDKYEVRDCASFPYSIVAMGDSQSEIAGLGQHAFLNTLYRAYAEHRPVVLSPDMMWLLICQGFMQHLNTHSEQLRKNFVEFGRKKELVAILEGDKDWNKIAAQFSEQIAHYTGKDLMNNLLCNFSTTTPNDVIASEVTVMGGMSSYFTFIVVKVVCGIPEITLLGTTDDWERLVDKVHYLGQRFEMDWWTGKVERIMKEFVRASRGNVNADFWRDMFKYRQADRQCGKPGVIDGWICTFFPYDKEGNLNDLKQITNIGKLPNQYSVVDFKLIDTEQGDGQLDMEMWAGFFGAEQNVENFALTPKITWFVRRRDKVADLDNVLKVNDNVLLRGVKEIPSEFLAQKKITFLQVIFDGKINIPDELTKVDISRLNLYGEINNRGIERIKKLFPRAMITINSEKIQ